MKDEGNFMWEHIRNNDYGFDNKEMAASFIERMSK